MHLHQHLCVQTFAPESFIDMQHGDLHDVAGRALDWHVDAFAFGRAANVRVAIVDAWQRAYPPIERTHVSMLTRLHWNLVHVPAHAFVSGVVIIDHFACFLAADADALRQTPRLDRVSDGEVHNLR